VVEGGEGTNDTDVAPEFLADLADDGGGRILARLNLAAREFPFKGQEFVGWTLRDEDAAVLFDHSTDNGNGRRGTHV
jgi:hypothetical protein